MKERLRTVFYFVATALTAALLAVSATLIIQGKNKGTEVILTADEYANLREVASLSELADKIESEFYGEMPSRDELLSAAAKGMVGTLNDPYASYFTNEEYEQYLSELNGEYSGVGILIAQPDETGAKVLEVYEGNPASEAGVEAGDIITHIDGEPIAGMLLSDVSYLMNGENGTVVKLTIARADEHGKESTHEISVTRAVVNIQRVHYALYNQRTGYIRIDMFTGNCESEFETALRALQDRGMKSLVIDLRNNPGGSLNAVLSVADALLGQCDIVSIRGNGDDKGEVYTSNAKGVTVPIAVLVNENSASASEILAAAIQDNDAGIVVGMQTFGKGIVQTTYRLESNGGWLKLTTDGYYTPNGESIHGVGVMPDIVIDLPEELKSLTIAQLCSDHQSEDAQLWAALNYVREKALEQS